ncbi:Metallo-dependent phosphatase-like protein [Aspergillus varians]
MNHHLLPFPYNQSQPLTWWERVLQPPLLSFIGGPIYSTPQKPSTSPIPTQPRSSGWGDSRLPPIRVICISDTHNATPPLPPGDILIHAGDLSARGTFDEVQAQLRWLAAQPHPHKIVIAGNHDLLLDEASDGKFPARGELNSEAKRKDLDWGGIWYLQDEAVTLEVQTELQLRVPGPGEPQLATRRVKIYGSSLTPEFGHWAFQYPAIRDVWTGKVPDDTDILVVHAPPALYGDCDGEGERSGDVEVKGDGYLLREIRRIQPKMVVCGHIHGAFGAAVIQHDGIQDVMDGLQMRWGGYDLVGALKGVVRRKVTTPRDIDRPKETLVLNAAVAPGALESVGKSAIAVDLL